MSGINEIVAFAVNRIKVKFSDSCGFPKKIIGTGFWVELPSKKRIFITNKHNVDPTLIEGKSTDYDLEEINIELRKAVTDQKKEYFPETSFFQIKDISSSLFKSDNSDCAIIVPDFIEDSSEFQPIMVFNKSHLADECYHREKIQIMDFASFIGFPGSEWYDQEWKLPISRLANIASFPSIPFTHGSITTDDVTLISGLSFSGSSGSPIISHLKHVIEDTSDTLTTSFNTMIVPPMIIGIMSGHYWEANKEPEIFKHSGLSYYTRSTSILNLINKNKL